MRHSRHLRDRVAHRLANAALRIATPWYRDMIGGAIRYGMQAAARDSGAGVVPEADYVRIIESK